MGDRMFMEGSNTSRIEGYDRMLWKSEIPRIINLEDEQSTITYMGRLEIRSQGIMKTISGRPLEHYKATRSPKVRHQTLRLQEAEARDERPPGLSTEPYDRPKWEKTPDKGLRRRPL